MTIGHLFPQEGHPVIHQRGVEFPQVQMWVVSITPAGEVPQFSAIAVLGLLGPRAGALLQESLQEELVPPEDCTGLGGIKEPTDVCQSLCLVQPCQHRRESGIVYGITAI